MSIGGLTTGPIQRSLFGDPRQQKREVIEAVSAQVRERFGSTLLTRGTLLDRDD